MFVADLSYNHLEDVVFPSFAALQQVDLSGTKFNIAPPLTAPKLLELRMDQSAVVMVDFSVWYIPNVQRYVFKDNKLGCEFVRTFYMFFCFYRLSLADSFSLKFVNGRMPKSLKKLSITGAQLSAFPQSFFSEYIFFDYYYYASIASPY